MYQFNFENADLIDFLKEVSITNLTEEKSKYLTMMINDMSEYFRNEVEKIVKLEQAEFEKQNKVYSCGYVETQVKSMLVPTFTIKHKRYRNKEFHSVLIGKKTNRFFMDFIMLLGMIRALCPTYEGIKELFNFFGSSMSNEMISNVKKAVERFDYKVMMKEKVEIGSHLLAMFIDGQRIPLAESGDTKNPETGEKLTPDNGKITRITAIGIDTDGNKKVLAHSYGSTENQATITDLFIKLKEEIGIETIDCIVADGTIALDQPMKEFFPETKRQLCAYHFEQTINKLARTYQKERFINLIQMIAHADSREEAYEI